MRGATRAPAGTDLADFLEPLEKAFDVHVATAAIEADDRWPWGPPPELGCVIAAAHNGRVFGEARPTSRVLAFLNLVLHG